MSVTPLRPAPAWWWLALALGMVGPWLNAAAADEAAVALPPFIVEELAKGPPWRYAESNGFEILSRCSDATTQRVVEAHHQLHVLLDEILPPSLRLKLSVPRTLILYDEELQPASSQEVIRSMVRSTPAGPEEDFGAMPGGRGFRVPAPARRYSFLPNLRLWDRDVMAVFMIVRRDDFEADRLSLTHDYVTFLVKNRLPALPAWFVSGILALYHQTTYGGGQLTVEPLEWISEAFTSALKKDPKTAPPVGPLADFFSVRLAPRDPVAAVDPVQAWLAQAALVVRWGLDADRRAHRQALWTFVARSAVEGTSEKLFTACFGFDYAAAREQLTAYLPTAVRKTARFQPAKRVELPQLPLANASDGQIARIKGDWERMEVPYVKRISADLAPKYLAQARRTLRRAYDRDERDPRLLAVMGLCECDAGEDAAAREYLESAARIGPIRPRANYELARLRLAAFRAQPAAADGRLDVNQTAEVLRPLFAARAEQPPLPEVYELIGEAWAHCISPPTRQHLAVLDEGVRLFPRHTDLVLRAAELNLKHGFPDVAATLIALGLSVASDEPTRAPFIRLQQQLAPP